jgi:hypothetical protein
MTRRYSDHATLGYGLALLSVLACNNANFRTASERAPAGQPGVGSPQIPPQSTLPGTVTVNCGAGTNGAATVAMSMSRGAPLTVRGEVCSTPQRVQDPATVLFVIDSSDSMGHNDPRYRGGMGDSCGRLEAARALVGKLESEVADLSKVRLGVVPFRDDAMLLDSLLPIVQFKAMLIADNFCYSNYLSNHQAALETARETLVSMPGKKSVFFVTDGMPSVSRSGRYNNSPRAVYDDGLRAGASLRALPDVELNAIFLKPTGRAESLEQLSEAEPYLQKIVGDSAHVRTASSAADLANQIVKFASPRESVIASADVAVQLIDADQQERSLALANFVQKEAGKVWSFETSPVVPRFLANASTQSLTIKITTQGGRVVQEIKINVDVIGNNR